MRLGKINITLTGEHNLIPLHRKEVDCVAKRTRSATKNQPTPSFFDPKANVGAVITYFQKVAGWNQDYPQLVTVKSKRVVQVNLTTAEIWAGRASAVFTAVILAKGHGLI